MSDPGQAASDLILCIGVGNEYRRDDGAGLVVARELQVRNLPGLIILEAQGEGTSLMEMWETAKRVILIDAVRSGTEAGTIFRFDAHLRQIPSDFFCYSTHTFGVTEALELARLLGRLPPYIVVYGIEGADFGSGIGLSQPVREAAVRVAQEIAQTIREMESSGEQRL